jgi:hypothetical protein
MAAAFVFLFGYCLSMITLHAHYQGLCFKGSEYQREAPVRISGPERPFLTPVIGWTFVFAHNTHVPLKRPVRLLP